MKFKYMSWLHLHRVIVKSITWKGFLNSNKKVDNISILYMGQSGIKYRGTVTRDGK